MDGEVWKDVVGYEGLYMVSNLGNVDSVRFLKRKRLHRRVKDGYCFVVLCNNTDRKQKAVHRLVAEAFIPKADATFNEINHIDENPSNNCVENLEWCNRKYNMNYGTQKERSIQTGRARGRRVSGVRVIQFDRDGNKVAEYLSIRDAQRATGIDATTITKCCSGYFQRKTAGGYKWEYGN